MFLLQHLPTLPLFLRRPMDLVNASIPPLRTTCRRQHLRIFPLEAVQEGALGREHRVQDLSVLPTPARVAKGPVETVGEDSTSAVLKVGRPGDDHQHGERLMQGIRQRCMGAATIQHNAFQPVLLVSGQRFDHVDELLNRGVHHAAVFIRKRERTELGVQPRILARISMTREMQHARQKALVNHGSRNILPEAQTDKRASRARFETRQPRECGCNGAHLGEHCSRSETDLIERNMIRSSAHFLRHESDE
eukprot:5553451-Prymnesium_polylepis.1